MAAHTAARAALLLDGAATARQVYRASRLIPKTYESAGTRHDGRICREGSVELRGALLELGMGLWLNEPGGTGYGGPYRGYAAH